jgi:hypothetical protein
MLKLVFHTTDFGSFNFEFFKPYIRVGRQPDNDLVLPHPSVQPYHCIIVFREDSLVVLPPESTPNPGLDPQQWDGPVYGAGDTLRVGELALAIELSRNTVAIPKLPSRRPPPVHPQAWPLTPTPADTPQTPTATTPDPAIPLPEGPLYLCVQCQCVFPDAAVTRIGLVGHSKHRLCPHCSYPVEPYQKPAAPAASFGLTLRRSWDRFKRWLLNLGSR